MENPQVIADRYELLEIIGEGGVGSVYRARDRKFAVQVAIKLMRSTGDGYLSLRDRAWQEAQISHVLGQERGLVRAIDWGEIEDQAGRAIYLALDLVEGARPLDLGIGDLELRLASLAEAAHLIAVCHRHNVVHRDVKPANFLVGGDGRLYLSDFGISKKLGSLSDSSEDLSAHLRTATGLALGTPVFMPIEQLEDASSVDASADVFGLGVMLFFLLTGQYPYGMGGIPLVYGRQSAVRRGERPPPRPSRLVPEVPPHLDRLCSSAVSVERERRPDVETFLRELGLPLSDSSLEKTRRQRMALHEEVDRVLGGEEKTLRVDRSQRVLPPTPKPWGPLDLARIRAQLGIEQDGFAETAELRRRLSAWGAKKTALVTQKAPLVLVHDERPLNGVTRLIGRCALLLPSPERAGAPEVILGRSRTSDLQIGFPSISKQQLRFAATPAGWTVTDLGSRNGTELNGNALPKDEPRPLREGDLIHLSRHVTLRYVPILSLDRWVKPRSSAP